MKLGVVVQRYGADINGGAELHARYIAERMSRHAHVTVLTTCATDYVTWRNALPPGRGRVNGVDVERYPVSRERDIHEFGRRSERVFHARHSVQDELAWLDSEGPLSPGLVRRLRRAHDFDYVLLFSARYYTAYHGARAVPQKAILVPTAEREPSLGLSIFGPVFRGVRAIMYNSFEERALIQSVSANRDVPGVVVGVGSDIPESTSPARFRQKHGIAGPYVVYVGRIDENKGCAELFDYFLRYADAASTPLSLVLIGTAVLPVPKHPRIRHLGFVPDEDKFDAIAGAEALVMPSYFESLSMVALEAWALGRPVVANAHCDVLLGQCIRSNAGLYYTDYPEFGGVLNALLENAGLAAALGRNGREYFSRHYAWPVVESKYLDTFARLEAENAAEKRQMERLPGWLQRRRRGLRAAADVVASLPSGPALGRPQREARA